MIQKLNQKVTDKDVSNCNNCQYPLDNLTTFIRHDVSNREVLQAEIEDILWCRNCGSLHSFGEDAFDVAIPDTACSKDWIIETPEYRAKITASSNEIINNRKNALKKIKETYLKETANLSFPEHSVLGLSAHKALNNLLYVLTDDSFCDFPGTASSLMNYESFKDAFKSPDYSKENFGGSVWNVDDEDAAREMSEAGENVKFERKRIAPNHSEMKKRLGSEFGNAPFHNQKMPEYFPDVVPEEYEIGIDKGAPEGDKTATITLDFEKAYKRFERVKKTYEDLRGMPGVNVELALQNVFAPIQERYDSGERSQSLYDEMMSVE